MSPNVDPAERVWKISSMAEVTAEEKIENESSRPLLLFLLLRGGGGGGGGVECREQTSRCVVHVTGEGSKPSPFLSHG